jgi:hypothetical protein
MSKETGKPRVVGPSSPPSDGGNPNTMLPVSSTSVRGYPGMILLTLKDLWRLPSRYPCGCSGKRLPPGPLLSA